MFKFRKSAEPPPTDPVPAATAGAPIPRPAESSSTLPPFRPAPPKEALPMSRPPFPTAPQQPIAPAGTGSPQPVAAARQQTSVRQPVERRTLVVGRGIAVHGTIQDAERLVVEGTVEAKMIHATELSISQGGVFRGEAEVEEAEVAGTIDGTLTARNALIVRATGRVLGIARCRRLQVEDGGQITGQIEMITEPREGTAEARPTDPLA